MEIRPYQSNDLTECLRLFDSNPDFFVPGEREQFQAFLEGEPGTYFVLEHDGKLVGCGGFALEAEPGLASLTWGLIDSRYHRQGLGRLLLFHRMKEISKLGNISLVRLETTPLTAPFFERAGGFRVTNIEPGAYGGSLDRVTLMKRLAVCV